MKRQRSDNLMLISASQLPFQAKWRLLADGLPAGSVLFVVPRDETPVKRSMRKVASTLHHQGRRIAATSVAP